MKLKLNLSLKFLACLFKICTSVVSRIIFYMAGSARKRIMATQEQIHLYCFKKYMYVRAIIDCTEMPIQSPSLARANKPTAKVLVACTADCSILIEYLLVECENIYTCSEFIVNNEGAVEHCALLAKKCFLQVLYIESVLVH